MNAQYILLSPVREEDLRLTFGHTEPVNIVADPEIIFAPTIAHFKKLAIGEYFWFIADPVNWVVNAAGGSMEKIMPIKENELVKKSPEVLFRNTHPDDIVQMFAFSNYWIQFYAALSPEKKAHVRATTYLRMLNLEKNYSWFMIQYVDTIIDREGKILYGLTLVTDISHVKKEGVAMMSILDTYKDNCQQFLCVDGKSLTNPENKLPKLSKREIEVLRYLAKGFSSKQIASELKIANKTIDNHRQNLLRKTNTKSSGELVAYGIGMGYI